MGSKRRENKKSSTIVTRRTSLGMNAHLGPLPPKSNKPKTNNSDGGASSSKKRANMESAAIVAQSSTDQRGKAKLTPNSDSLAVSKPISRKGQMWSPPVDVRKAKGNWNLLLVRLNQRKWKKGKAIEDGNPRSKKAKLTISEERANVHHLPVFSSAGPKPNGFSPDSSITTKIHSFSPDITAKITQFIL